MLQKIQVWIYIDNLTAKAQTADIILEIFSYNCHNFIFLFSRDFGNKIIQIKPMVKFLPKLIEDRDKNVREETKQLIIEIYRWIGPAIKAKLTDLKPVQVCAW